MNLIERIFGAQPAPRKFWRRIPVPADDMPADGAAMLRTDEAYFQFRLVEMHLRDARSYGVEYLPLGAALTECVYAGKGVSLPFIVSNKILDGLEGVGDDGRVDFANIRLAGPLPYAGGDLRFFFGLYRAPVRDYVREAFSFIEDLSSLVGVDLSLHLDIAGKVVGGLSSLFGRDDMSCRVGRITGFDTDGDPGIGDAYHLFVNAPENDFKDQTFAVRDDRLYRRRNGGALVPFDSHDYCLTRLVCRDARGDYQRFEFHQLFLRAKELLWDGRPEQADWLMVDMAKLITTSPDLTRPHKRDLILLYRSHFDQERELIHKVTARPGAVAVRGAAVGSASGAIEIMAQIAGRARLNRGVEGSLLAVSRNWERLEGISDRTDRGATLTDDDMDRQLRTVRRITAPAADADDTVLDGLVETFSLAALPD